MEMDIRAYRETDCHEIADLFHGAVHNIEISLYSKKQLEAWSPTPPNYEQWKVRLEVRRPFVAVQSDKVIGFIELESDGHIDCMYVHLDYQRKGVARNMFSYLSKEAVYRGINQLNVDASKLAKPFFEKIGFVTTDENIIIRNGIELINYKMTGKPIQ